MEILCCKTYDELSFLAAGVVTTVLEGKKSSAFCLPTGSTPLGMYAELVRRVESKSISFKNSSFYSLDEYVGLPAEHPQSYAHYLNTVLFDKIDVDPDNIHLPNGLSRDDDEECDRYTALIDDVSRGFDLLVLGIGSNGHIGANEPADVFYPNTHKTLLDPETIAANARFFENPSDVPRFALTMGVRPMMRAKKIILLASGSGKAVPIAKTINGPITPRLPASILQLHPDVTVIADEAALALVHNL